MALNLHLLRVFYNVIEQRSFSLAAKALYISQPAVSKAIRELEHQTGLPLVERGVRGRGVRPTTDGRALFEHARSIFALEKAALDEIRARTGLRRGSLVVGASTTIAGYWLPPYLAGFARAHSDVAVALRVGNTEQIADALIDGRVDIALVEGQVNDPRISAHPWRQDPLTIVAPPGLAPADSGTVDTAWLNGHTWLVREPGSGTRQVTQALLRDLGLSPERSIEIGNSEAIARAVSEGLGIAMLPRVVVDDLLTLGRLQALAWDAGTALSRPLLSLRCGDRPLSPAAQAFLDTLRDGPAPIPAGEPRTPADTAPETRP